MFASFSAAAANGGGPTWRIGAVRIARKLCVGQARAEVGELVRANGKGRQKIVRAGSAHNVVLVHAVAADPDGADQLAVAIEREAAGKNRDAVRESRVQPEGGSRTNCGSAARMNPENCSCSP